MITIQKALATDKAISALVQSHLASLAPTAPAESRHALAVDALASETVQLWAASIDGHLAGIIARQQLSEADAEIKSMKTVDAYLRRGVAAALLAHLITDSREAGYQRLYLETGAVDYFKPAHALYERYGFSDCEPFGNYQPDPNSRFMQKTLS